MTENSLTDPNAVAAEYVAAGRLQTRIGFYDRFSRDEPWTKWLHRRVVTAPGLQIADVGCGPARLWADHGGPPDGRVVLVDKFPAMLEAAEHVLAGRDGFEFICADISRGWQPHQSFDVILAAHVIYHLEDIRSFVQLARDGLVPQGRLYVSFPAMDHLAAIRDLLRSIGVRPWAGVGDMESEMEEILAAAFASVSSENYSATLRIDDAEALFHFVKSFRPLHDGALDDASTQARFRAAAMDRVASGVADGTGFVVMSRNRLVCARN